MKKSYLMIAAAAALLTACSSNDTFKEVLDNNETILIGFETFHEKATRATDVIDDPTDFIKDHGGFGVWGYKGAPDAVVPASGTPTATVNVSSLTPVFENVQVWYENSNTKPKGFTYTVPKYWDKNAEYIFFAYAPYDATNASISKTNGNIEIKAIPSIQDVSKSNGETGADLAYSGSTTTSLTDYLMATYVPEQKLVAENKATTAQGTNQNYGNGTAITYSGQEQTVGFTFGHMLSKLQINLQAAEQYSGVQYIEVTSLSIENMPASASTTTIFTQVSPTAPAGTYNPSNYTSELKIIGTGGTSANSLYILKNGSKSDDETITAPAKQVQSFNYYAAPNKPSGNGTDKYLLNISYKIHYVDGIEETVDLTDIDLSAKLSELVQNNQYIFTINVALNQIYFNVDAVTGWNDATESDITVK